MVRAGLRWLIKHRNHRELTVEQHRRFVTVAERLVPDPPPHIRTGRPLPDFTAPELPKKDEKKADGN